MTDEPTVPCAARATPACRVKIPLPLVAARDPMDGAALCSPCCDALGILPEYRREL